MNEANFKKYLGFLLVTAGMATALFIFLNWQIDPLQFYRKAFYPPFFIGQQRYQNPGLAKNYAYDSVILGTSLSEKLGRDLVKEKLGWNAINFAMQGASAREQSLMLQVILRKGTVKNVIWDLNYEYFRGAPEWVSSFDGAFPAYFYDDNHWNEIGSYLLSIDTSKSSLKVILRKFGLNTYQDRRLDEAWTRSKPFGIDAVRKSWQRAVKARSVLRQQVPDYAATNLNASFQSNILKLVTKHPNVKFHFYFPPFTIGYYANVLEVSPEIFHAMLANRKYIHDQTRNLKNVELYDFQTASNVITNLENYCDLMHFGTNVNEYIIESVRQKRHFFDDPDSGELRALVTKDRAREWVLEHIPK